MTQEKTQATVLYSPYYHAYTRDTLKCDDTHTLCVQLRLEAVEAIRSYRAGEKPLKNLLIGLEAANTLLKEFGYPTIEFDPRLD